MKKLGGKKKKRFAQSKSVKRVYYPACALEKKKKAQKGTIPVLWRVVSCCFERKKKEGNTQSMLKKKDLRKPQTQHAPQDLLYQEAYKTTPR